ncbi:natural cytotoxicity triggering receptor 3-like [Lissotriton helveticus]
MPPFTISTRAQPVPSLYWLKRRPPIHFFSGLGLLLKLLSASVPLNLRSMEWKPILTIFIAYMILHLPLCPGSNVTVLTVWQHPFLNATAGQTAVLKCTFTNQEQRVARVRWTRELRHWESVDPINPHYQGRLNLSSIEQNRLGETTAAISDLNENDSDVYHCIIEVNEEGKREVVARGKGVGTRLQVVNDQIQGQMDTASQIRTMIWSWSIRSTLVFLLISGGLLGCFLSSHSRIHVEEEMEESPP